MDFFYELKKWLRRCKDECISSVSVELVIFSFSEERLKILISKPKEVDGWLLPRGYILKDESLEAAAARNLGIHSNPEEVLVRQFHTFGDPGRLDSFRDFLDRHSTWHEFMNSLDKDESIFLLITPLTVGFYSLVDAEKFKLIPDFKTDYYSWVDVSEVPPLLADHNKVLEQAIKSLRLEMFHQPIVAKFLPKSFVFEELHAVYETILEKKVNRENFYKTIMSTGMIEKLKNKAFDFAGHPSWLYRFKSEYGLGIEDKSKL